jgi:hypothetical protein
MEQHMQHKLHSKAMEQLNVLILQIGVKAWSYQDAKLELSVVEDR